MLPTVVAAEVQRALLDYLRTTFRLQDKALEGALFRFLSDEKTGMFQGPYLDVRLPFRKAHEDWEARSPLEFNPPFPPYLHQLQAFERLSSLAHRPSNTLVTTGTGSGKTECFLYPVLDHCRRARLRGERGIKAIILYPMNALAGDQAERLAQILHEHGKQLGGVGAGLYVGGKGTHGTSDSTHLVDDRSVLRKSPPDILLTNYRMLDFLLMRPEDAELWDQNAPTTLQYLVLDELHTYDGAQGSDVACLIRRLKARLDIPESHLCCVGTSATIGSGGTQDPRESLAAFAEQIFAEPFAAESLIEEVRQTPEEAFIDVDMNAKDPFTLSDVTWEKLAPAKYASIDDYVLAQRALWFEDPSSSPHLYLMELGAHPFLRKLLRGIVGKERRSGPRNWREVAAQIAKEEAEFAELSDERQWLSISSFVSLISQAKVPATRSAGAPHPFLDVQVQLWVRELHGLLRAFENGNYRFAWQDELDRANEEHWLPMVYCRECGFDGFAALKREGEDKLRDAPGDIAEAFLHRGNRARVLDMRQKVPESSQAAQTELMPDRICPRCLQVQAELSCRCNPLPTATLPAQLHPQLGDAGKPLPLQRCPACHADDGIGFLASRAATLSSVSVSELFISSYNTDPKLLAFTDSVQDASHRAGFFAARTFRFSLRTAIQGVLEEQKQAVPLPEMCARVIEHWSQGGGLSSPGEAKAAALLVPPDLNEDPAYVAYFAADKPEKERAKHRPTKNHSLAMRELLAQRLSWELTREYGLAVPLGRSLDATTCSTLAFDSDRLDAAANELTAHLTEHHRASFIQAPDVQRVVHYLEGMLQRLRLRGGIHHPLLETFAKTDRRFLLSKVKNPRLSRFGPNSAVPRFWYHGEAQPKSSYQALYSTTKQRTWYRVWTARALGLQQENDASINSMVERAARALRDHGLVSSLQAQNAEVTGIDPVAALVTRDVRRVRCPHCGHKLTLESGAARRFVDQRCLGFACHDGRYVIDDTSEVAESYYRDLYKSGRVERVFAGEHTGLLERAKREDLETAFKRGSQPNAPNLLTCTPTLEMGIDIGDLSSVMLCAVPPLPANYVQRVGRAGRKNGNAMILTVVNRRPHDRYFFEDPYEMLRGEIAPPGCFLDAPEILARQLMAFCLDAWAKSLGKTQRLAIPPRMQLLRLGAKDGFPGQFWPFYQQRKQALAEQFLTLFAKHIGPANAETLRSLCAGSGQARRMNDAFEAVKAQIKDYSSRIKDVQKRLDELKEDPGKATVNIDPDTGEERVDFEEEVKELEDTWHAYRRLRAQLNYKYPLEVLASDGVIPNYAFPEPGVTLSALLREPFEEDTDTKPGDGSKETKKRGQRVEYTRAASQAIRDFAPFNTFYAEGHKIKVTQLDLGNKGSALEVWRICAECHHMEPVLGGQAPQPHCPQCHDGHWADTGQRRTLVKFRRALSVLDRVAASTADDAEERDRQSYALHELMDVGTDNYAGAHLVQKPGLVFGYELLQRQTLREINFGRSADRSTPSDLAGRSVAQRGFLVCRDCGRVSDSEARAVHAPTCGVRRRNTKANFERVFLYREFKSEALRLLLPISELEDQRLLHSMKAALFLGFRKKFLGHPDHLRITTVKEPRAGVTRNFLVVYDTVPGGTGYLAELCKSTGIFEILELARDAMESCRCASDDAKDGCYRCVYAYQQSRDLPYISRRRAVESLEAILASKNEFEDVDTLSGADIGDLTESELERKFLAALAERATAPGNAWTPAQYGGKTCYLLKTPNSEWRLEPQVDLGAESGVFPSCRPDFVLWCESDATQRPIAVFCDGLAYHVCPGNPEARIGDDIVKRSAVLESGHFLVWSLTWKDLEQAASTTLLTRVQRDLYQQLIGKTWQASWKYHQEHSGQSSFQLLWEYLEDPDHGVWQRWAIEVAAAMISVKPRWTTDSIKAQQQHLREHHTPFEVLLVADDSAHPPKRWGGLDSRSHSALLTQIPTADLTKKNLAAVELTLRLFDSASERTHPDFEESWRAFLHAWNVLQFHPNYLEVQSTELLTMGLEEPEAARESLRVRVSSRPPSEAPAEFDAFAAFADEFADGAHLAELSDLLREHTLAIPLDAGEHDFPLSLEALLIWPQQRLVLVQDLSDSDRAQWREHGYRAFDYDAPAADIFRALLDSPS